MKTKRIAVLMTVYNRKKVTLNCLKRLYEQIVPTDCQIDVYVTDDGCTDGTPETIKRLFPQVFIINGNGKLFWNHGMIKAWEAAVEKYDYDFYLWLNDDTELYEDSINRLIDNSIKCKHEALLVGTTCSSKDEMKYTYGGRYCNKPIISPSDTDFISCDEINGNVVLIPKYIYNKIGMNDPTFFHSRGDFDYSLRAKKYGLNVFVSPGLYGICDRHDFSYKWFDPKYSIKQRFKLYFSKYGFYARHEFLFVWRHFGILRAIIQYIKGIVHVLFPSLWNHIKAYVS